NMLEPGDVLAVEMLLQRNMHHVGLGAGAVPVLLVGRDPDRVARPDLADRAAPELYPADAGDHVQGLAERVGVPGGARLRLEPDDGAADARWRRCLDDRLLPDRAGERVGRTTARGQRAQRFDVHCGGFLERVAGLSFRLLLERDDFSSNRHPAPGFWRSMIFSENREPLFGIML